jgi:hypothetical protein
MVTFDSFDIDIATQSIGRHLRLARWSRKVVKARAATSPRRLAKPSARASGMKTSWYSLTNLRQMNVLAIGGMGGLHKVSSAELIGR